MHHSCASYRLAIVIPRIMCLLSSRLSAPIEFERPSSGNGVYCCGRSKAKASCFALQMERFVVIMDTSNDEYAHYSGRPRGILVQGQQHRSLKSRRIVLVASALLPKRICTDNRCAQDMIASSAVITTLKTRPCPVHRGPMQQIYRN